MLDAWALGSIGGSTVDLTRRSSTTLSSILDFHEAASTWSMISHGTGLSRLSLLALPYHLCRIISRTASGAKNNGSEVVAPVARPAAWAAGQTTARKSGCSRSVPSQSPAH